MEPLIDTDRSTETLQKKDSYNTETVCLHLSESAVKQPQDNLCLLKWGLSQRAYCVI